MKLFFTKDAYYNNSLVFEAGKEYEVEEKAGYAQRWLTRGVAYKVEVKKEEKPKAAPKKVEEKKIVIEEPKKVEEKEIKAEDIL